MKTELTGGGLGDLVEKVAKPIAKALGMDCLDKEGNLRPESKCAEKRDRLNRSVRLPRWMFRK